MSILNLLRTPKYVLVHCNYLDSNNELKHYTNRYSYQKWKEIKSWYTQHCDYERVEVIY